MGMGAMRYNPVRIVFALVQKALRIWRRTYWWFLCPSLRLAYAGQGSSISVTDGGSLSSAARLVLSDHSSITVKFGTMRIGRDAFFGNGTVIVCREEISIGDNVLFAEHVTIRDQDHIFGPGLITAKSGFETEPVKIGNNVWLGAKVTVTKGVTIGDNSVVGANSVVTKDLPANCVAAGSPARVVRMIDGPGAAPSPSAGGA